MFRLALMNKSTSAQSLYRYRAIKDLTARYMVSLGGIGVLMAILLIFFYLLYVVIPLFEPADISELRDYPVPGEGKTLHVGVEEQGQVAVNVTDAGKVVFFDTENAAVMESFDLSLNADISSVATSGDNVALGLANGEVIVFKYLFDVSYPDDKRQITPRIEFPLGEEPVVLDEESRSLTQLALQISGDLAGLIGVTDDDHLIYSRYTREESFLDESITTELESTTSKLMESPVKAVVLTPLLDNAYAAAVNGMLLQFKLDDEGFDGPVIEKQLDHEITAIKLLLGGVSLMVGMENGETQQWMPVRVDNQKQLTLIRSFADNEFSVESIAVEKARKGFSVAGSDGGITLYYTTSHRTLANIDTSDSPVTHMAWSERAQHLLAVNADGQLHLYEVENEYPEISWDVLWGKVWYEGYDEPEYLWQSSASTNEFEPKFSLVPLSFGTIKAAIYAMMFAIPIAVLGAIFTAQFMAPRMRQVVKPSIEIMEALPTVILGFLAGLWLAPYVEQHLIGVFVLLMILPPGFILTAWFWQYVPGKNRFDGWEAALLIPVIIFFMWLAMAISVPVENAFFDGDIRIWLQQEWGIGYDQRNALVVGLIMGFAVIPTIFSMAEDALFTVPQHLINGSLALGASRWQTLLFVVLPAASPGIFSALMMGFGRAVGETMIVLMATGNTPVMDMSLFNGMRTLAANIAVEVPEAEVASTHYRVLFLAALVLFAFTFIFNTAAEVVRQRMRKRYSAL